ncbi:MAG: diaminopimelate epimerase [Ilumatobacteraceae bacterium]|nr:diaminopimelate epimerase [Ilumatobacteraceae bacterium]
MLKAHGLGNDFLVLAEPLDEVIAPGSVADGVWAERARNWCGRRRGIGADGLLVPSVPRGAALTMTLYNADGSRAEMSGNGIRCFVHALITAEVVTADRVEIDTDAGQRTVTVVHRAGDEMISSVSMGAVGAGTEPSGWSAIGVNPDRPVAHLSLGNPHAVVGVDDVHAVDLGTLGAMVPDVNLEVVAPGPGPHDVTMRVHERGVGVTEACGTGACATAVAALEWGLVAADAAGAVGVHMAGGTVRVFVDRASRTAVLEGPSVVIADIRVEQ